jgi:hypothetical protein
MNKDVRQEIIRTCIEYIQDHFQISNGQELTTQLAPIVKRVLDDTIGVLISTSTIECIFLNKDQKFMDLVVRVCSYLGYGSYVIEHTQQNTSFGFNQKTGEFASTSDKDMIRQMHNNAISKGNKFLEMLLCEIDECDCCDCCKMRISIPRVNIVY